MLAGNHLLFMIKYSRRQVARLEADRLLVPVFLRLRGCLWRTTGIFVVTAQQLYCLLWAHLLYYEQMLRVANTPTVLLVV
jgi:hypothetical protein